MEEGRIDPSLADESGRPPLAIACSKGHLAVVQALLEEECIDPNRADKYGENPLYKACYHGHLGVVQALLAQACIDPNPITADDCGRWSPLHAACAQGDLLIVKKLFEHRELRVHMRTLQGKTPLALAKERGATQIVAFLERACVDMSERKKCF